MSYQRERDEFIARCHLSSETARALLRHATTLQRLAVAQCNGDWPCDNGERKTEACPLCESYWVPSQIQGGTAALMAHRHAETQSDPNACGYVPVVDRRACPDCRTEARVRALLEGTQWQPYFQGDPRGYVLRLFPLKHEHCPNCGSHECTHEQKPVTHDDMYCGRVSALGVPTR